MTAIPGLESAKQLLDAGLDAEMRGEAESARKAYEEVSQMTAKVLANELNVKLRAQLEKVAQQASSRKNSLQSDRTSAASSMDSSSTSDASDRLSNGPPLLPPFSATTTSTTTSSSSSAAATTTSTKPKPRPATLSTSSGSKVALLRKAIEEQTLRNAKEGAPAPFLYGADPAGLRRSGGFRRQSSATSTSLDRERSHSQFVHQAEDREFQATPNRKMSEIIMRTTENTEAPEPLRLTNAAVPQLDDSEGLVEAVVFKHFYMPGQSLDQRPKTTQLERKRSSALDSMRGSISIEMNPTARPKELPTLSELFDPEALSALSNDEKKRIQVCIELWHTEKIHVQKLQILYKQFCLPLKQTGIIRPSDADLIFANLADVLEYHSFIAASLNSLQQASPSFQAIGACLQALLAGETGAEFRAVCATFCRKQQTALALLERRTAELSGFNRFLVDMEAKPESERLRLRDLIVVEMQRITKYPLLVEKLLNHTAESSDEARHLHEVLQCSRLLLETVNIEKRRYELKRRMDQLQRRLDTSAFDEAYERRTREFKQLDLREFELIHDGKLTWLHFKDKIQTEIILHVVLTDQVLILLKPYNKSMQGILRLRPDLSENSPSLLGLVDSFVDSTLGNERHLEYFPILKLEELMVKPKASDSLAFYVLSTAINKYAQMMEFVASSPAQRDEWVSQIATQIGRRLAETNARAEAVAQTRRLSLNRVSDDFIMVCDEGRELEELDLDAELLQSQKQQRHQDANQNASTKHDSELPQQSDDHDHNFDSFSSSSEDEDNTEEEVRKRKSTRSKRSHRSASAHIRDEIAQVSRAINQEFAPEAKRNDERSSLTPSDEGSELAASSKECSNSKPNTAAQEEDIYALNVCKRQIEEAQAAIARGFRHQNSAIADVKECLTNRGNDYSSTGFGSLEPEEVTEVLKPLRQLLLPAEKREEGDGGTAGLSLETVVASIATTVDETSKLILNKLNRC